MARGRFWDSSWPWLIEIYKLEFSGRRIRHLINIFKLGK